ncbi:MAG: NAD-dependent epimerase/dehydratase family protein [Chloroflexota bacterium]|nr:NAD-dependent epimerase/dehydratase family protein [Chloroflexota bacterium]MDE2918269.1 NAD-dependent epimerase/dehydratase family protein [Chloroflexota bacterium]
MHVLVTGGAGFIGSHVVDALLRRGHTVTVLDSLVSRVHPDRTWPDGLAAVRRIRGDVTQRDDWRVALNGADAVVHLAAYQDYQADFSRFALVNDAGTALLYELLVERKQPVQRVVVASSQAVYGEGAYQCPDHGRQYPPPRSLEQLARGVWDPACAACGAPLEPTASSERHPVPTNAYGISKLAGESYALTLGARHGIPTSALRFSIIQGPRQSPANAYSGVLRAFVGHIRHGRRPVVYEDGRQRRDYTHIRDAISAVELVLEHPDAVGQAFNVGGGQVTTVLEYAEAVLAAMGSNAEPDVSGRYRLGDTRHVWSDTARIRALGWRPTGTLHEIIRDYLAWIDAAPEGEDWTARALARMEAGGVVRQIAQGD